MSSKQPRKQRLARYTAPYHRRHREMSAPIDRGLRERQLSRGFMYPRAIPVRKGDRVMIVRGEGKAGSASKVAKIDRKARKVYVEGFTYFKSDGTELQRPIDASNLVIINPDWSDVRTNRLSGRMRSSLSSKLPKTSMRQRLWVQLRKLKKRPKKLQTKNRKETTMMP